MELDVKGDVNGEQAPEQLKIVKEEGLGYTLTVKREQLHQVALGLRDTGFDLFLFVSGIDFPDKVKLTYKVYSTKRKNKISLFIKTEVPKGDPVIDSLVSVWPAANWHEREAYDLFGVIFKDHPELNRIFMPDNWIGHPLRKDYVDINDVDGRPRR